MRRCRINGHAFGIGWPWILASKIGHPAINTFSMFDFLGGGRCLVYSRLLWTIIHARNLQGLRRLNSARRLCKYVHIHWVESPPPPHQGWREHDDWVILLNSRYVVNRAFGRKRVLCSSTAGWYFDALISVAVICLRPINITAIIRRNHVSRRSRAPLSTFLVPFWNVYSFHHHWHMDRQIYSTATFTIHLLANPLWVPIVDFDTNILPFSDRFLIAK